MATSRRVAVETGYDYLGLASDPATLKAIAHTSGKRAFFARQRVFFWLGFSHNYNNPFPTHDACLLTTSCSLYPLCVCSYLLRF